MWNAIKSLLSVFLPHRQALPRPREPLRDIGLKTPLWSETDTAAAGASAMVTTRSQDRASQNSASVSPSWSSRREGARSTGEHGSDQSPFAPARGGKRRRLSPPEQVAVPDSQASDDSGTARKLALRPHGSPDASMRIVDEALSSEDGAENEGTDNAEEEREVHVIEETQLSSEDLTRGEGAAVEDILEEGAAKDGLFEAGVEDTGSEIGETTLPESSQTLRYRENEQVVESTQDLDNNITTSDFDTQVTAGRTEPMATPPQAVQKLDERDLGDEMASQEIAEHSSAERSHVADAAPAATSKHFRFASEEPIAPPPTLPTANGQAELVAEESDDDAEPETVTAAAGQDQARAAAADSARATQRYCRPPPLPCWWIEANLPRDRALQDEKHRRRRRDAQLKEQAQSSKKQSKKATRTRRSRFDPSIAAAEDLARTLLANGPLPDVLPDEILNAHAAMAKQPAPIPHRTLESAPRKRKFEDVMEKPPKDVVRGVTRIRVLPQQKTTLPPRPSAQGRAIREQWLAGHRGDGRVLAQRRRPRHPLSVS